MIVKPLMIVMIGLPGGGKSTIPEALARELKLPVFAEDRLRKLRTSLHFSSTTTTVNPPDTNIQTTLAHVREETEV